MTYTHEDLDLANGTQLREFARETGFKGFSKLKVKELRDALRARLPSREAPPVPLFVELCAGTAALSLRLHQEGARPPVSRMGAKTGYANAILHALGLYPGQQAEHYLWCEPDAGVRLLLHAYTDNELAKAAADIIRGWKDEDPRALWERLRAEGPARCPPVDPREVARWAWVQGHEDMHGRDVKPQYQPGAKDRDTWKPPPSDWLARRFDASPTLPATIHDDARAIDPREVARWAHLMAAGAGKWGEWFAPSHPVAGWVTAPPETTARRCEDLPPVPATIHPDACAVEPPPLPKGTVVYIDPPYVGTTGYAHDLDRPAVVDLALKWHAAGATVAVSEAEPIPELVALGWRVVDITGQRQGQKRTFSKQKAEYLTISPES